MERAVEPAPFALRARMSALDLRVCAMVRRRPGMTWFEAHAPKLPGAREAALRRPAAAAIMARNRPD